MTNLKFKLVFFVVLNVYAPTIFADSEEGLITHMVKKALISTARACMDHVNATESDIEYLRKDPPFPEKSACIVKCLMEKIGIIKDSKFTKSGFLRTISPLVMKNKKKMVHMKFVAENCDREVNHETDTPCQVANEVAMCIFKYAPELHFKG